MYIVTSFVIVIGTLFILIYTYIQKCYKYWENRKIRSTKPAFPFGDFGNPFSKNKKGLNLTLKQIHDDFKSKGYKYGGFYVFKSPAFIVIDRHLVKDILTKDYQYFASHGNEVNAKIEPLAVNLFNMDGKEWREMRVKLTPTFTSGKMKMMFQIMLECGEQMREHLDNLHQKGDPLNIKEILACFTTDVIGSCAFGLDCNSFKYPNAEFRTHGRSIFANGKAFLLRRVLGIVAPPLVKLLKIRVFPKETSDFFIGIIRNITMQRENNAITRNDFLQLLLNLRKEAKAKGADEFTIEQMAAQSFVFFIAGFETSATTMTWCLYELAHHNEIQDRLISEINSTIKKHGGLTYDAVMEMKYLDQVVNETLRKHPPVTTLPRKCTQDYKLPENELLKNGTRTFVSILGMHHDPEYYPDPEKFDPDRFSEENKGNIKPFTFLPFGEGPRMCIGLRFGRLQTKVGLCMILGNYRVTPHDSLKYPIEYDGRSFVLAAKGDVLLKSEKING